MSNTENVCSRFWWDLRGASFFGLEEPNGAILDVKNSFAPEGRWRTFLRIAFLLWNLITLVLNLIIYPEENLFIFMGYLTHVTWVICIAYQLVVVFLSTRYAPTQPPTGETPGFLVKLTWILYSVAAPGSIAVVFLYWTLEYEGEDIGYYNIMKHGIVGLMIFVDGLVVAKIPVRLKHYLAFFLYGVGYVLWTALHSWLEIGNGTFEDDALYDVLMWNDSPISAIVVSVLVLLLLLPACYTVTWLSSLGWKLDGSSRQTLQENRTSMIEKKGSSSASSYVSMHSV